MQWIIDNRMNLTLSVSNINNIIDNSNKFTNLRKLAIHKSNHLCKYCGGKYNRYLFCVPRNNTKINSDNDLLVICKLCFMITNINHNYCKELSLCWSTLDQVEIVRKTVDFILKEQKVPLITEIDKNAKKIPMSLTEISNILIKYKKLPKEMNNYKIFVTQELDVSFIEYNSIIRPLFIDEESEEFQFSNNSSINNETITYHIFSNNEIKFLEKFFNNTYDKINDTLNNNISIFDK